MPDAQANANAMPDAAELTRRVALVAGIFAGDDYGARHDAPAPEGAPIDMGVQDDPTDDAADADSRIKKPQPGPKVTGGDMLYSGSFAHDVLAALNLPVTYENLRFMNAWMRAETGNQGKGTPAFNPLATTQKFGKYTQFNSVGVKNYADYDTGVKATANVMVNGHYQPILDALSKGNDAMAAARAVEQTPWGTGGGVLRVLGAK